MFMAKFSMKTYFLNLVILGWCYLVLNASKILRCNCSVPGNHGQPQGWPCSSLYLMSNLLEGLILVTNRQTHVKKSRFHFFYPKCCVMFLNQCKINFPIFVFEIGWRLVKTTPKGLVHSLICLKKKMLCLKQLRAFAVLTPRRIWI